MIDLRFPLKCDDNVWDGVFSEHTLEHLYPNQALALIKELHRTMKPGAWLRISVPNLEKYVDYYSGKPSDELFKQWESGCEAICFLTQGSIHYSVWDSKFLGFFLEKAGFINIRKVEFMQGTDPEIIKELASRKWESLYMEAQKPS
jgi:SAM-dependent methyltransferase